MPFDLDMLGGDLPTAGAFIFEVDGVTIGVFREVKGLKVELETEEIKEGGQNTYIHQVPGRMKWDNIVFRRGLTNNDALFEWFEHSSGEGFASKRNKLIRRTGAIVAMNYSGGRLRAWELIDAFPVRWSGPEFGTNKLEPLEEELEIAHHGFRTRTISSAR
jgi:phage tail-like protein